MNKPPSCSTPDCNRPCELTASMNFRNRCRRCRSRVTRRTDIAKQKQKQRELKQFVINRYGGACACCGESELAFLAIDHTDGSGAKHRKREGMKSGQAIYRWLQKHAFPEGFEVLCFNCNW